QTQLCSRRIHVERWRKKEPDASARSSCANSFGSETSVLLLFLLGLRLRGRLFLRFGQAAEIDLRLEEGFGPRGLLRLFFVDGLGRGRRLTARLPFGLIRRAGDVQRDRRGNFRMQRDGDVGEADRLDRLVELDLIPADIEALFREDLCDVAGRDRAVELA